MAVAGVTIWLLVAASGVLVLQPWRPEVPLSNDFVSFWTGAVFIRDGAGPALYDTSAQASFQANLRLTLTGTPAMRTGEILDPFHSPSAQALLLLPLTVLPVSLAYLLFSLGSLMAIWLAVALPLRAHPWGATLAVLMMSFMPVADTLIFGQVNAQFVLSLGLALVSLRAGRPFLGGALLGVLWLKPQYAVLFPVVFLLKRRWRELGGMTATGIALGAASVAMVGIDGAVSYAEMMREIGGFYAPPDAFIFPQSMVNWRAVITHLLPAVAEEVGWALMVTLGLATTGLSLAAWRGRWDPVSPEFPARVLVLVIASVLASPHSNFHGMVLILAPLAYLLASSWRPFTSRAVMPFVVLVYAGSLVAWPAKENSWFLVPALAIIAVLVTGALWEKGAPPEGAGV